MCSIISDIRMLNVQRLRIVSRIFSQNSRISGFQRLCSSSGIVSKHFFFELSSGVYIMENTMVGGGGLSLGKKIKNEGLGKKGKEKGRIITYI